MVIKPQIGMGMPGKVGKDVTILDISGTGLNGIGL
jgi:hypothetical protein